MYRITPRICGRFVKPETNNSYAGTSSAQQLVNDGIDVNDCRVEKLDVNCAGATQEQREFGACKDDCFNCIFRFHAASDAQDLVAGFRQELILQQFTNVLAVNVFTLCLFGRDQRNPCALELLGIEVGAHGESSSEHAGLLQSEGF